MRKGSIYGHGGALTDTSVLLEAAPSVFAVQLTDLVDATDNFAQERRIGKGGFGEVFCAEAIASLVPEKQPPGLQARRMAVKRASAAIERRDLECEVTMLQSCAHSHLLPLLGWCLEAACLVFPLMVGGSLQSRLDLAPQDVDYLQKMGHFVEKPKSLTWAAKAEGSASGHRGASVSAHTAKRETVHAASRLQGKRLCTVSAIPALLTLL